MWQAEVVGLLFQHSVLLHHDSAACDGVRVSATLPAAKQRRREPWAMSKKQSKLVAGTLVCW